MLGFGNPKVPMEFCLQTETQLSKFDSQTTVLEFEFDLQTKMETLEFGSPKMVL
jgi:hypothetical protein